MATAEVKWHVRLPSEANATGRNFGEEEITLLRKVLDSGVLNCTKGTMVQSLESAFAARLGVAHATAVTSGTAAVHAAIAAVDPEPGDEIIGSPITDMGAITPILYQAAIPVFADVDPRTLLVTAETIAPRITRRTRAIIVTHLFGNPCDMDSIMRLARDHGLIVIEDCAQAFDATCQGRRVGGIGDIGCFSLQQGKHITSGEGGLAVTNDPRFGRRIRLFHDKAWGYGDPNPDHYFLALNYRMTELQGAVALAQLEKLEFSVRQRQKMAQRLTSALERIPGVHLPQAASGDTHVYWKYCLSFDAANVGEVARFLREQYEIASAPRYIQKPAFECQVLRERSTFGKSHWPYDGECRAGDPPVDYDPAHFPGAVRGLASILVLPWNERYTEEHVDYIAAAVKHAVTRVEGREANHDE